MSATDLARAEAVKGILSDWAHWNRGYRIRLGYAPKSAGFIPGGTVTTETSAEDYALVDQARFEIVQTCVQELPPDRESAIYHRYLHAVYRMRDYAGSLLAAHEELSRTFRRKGILW